MSKLGNSKIYFAQVLIVLLDYGLPGSPESVLNDNGEPIVEFEEASKGGFNMFRTVLARIDTTRELTYRFNGFVRRLKKTFECQNTLLPGKCHEDTQIKLHTGIII